MTPLQKNAAAVLAAIALASTLASCADSTGGAGDQPATSGTYTDGSYDASGTYTSPNGQEEIDVTLTLADNIITAVKVVGQGSSPDSKRYQGEFIDGIADAVVGKNIDEIQVDRVGGSSLTSGGFNKAVEQIKAEADA